MSTMAESLKEAACMTMLAAADMEQSRRFWRDTIGCTEIEYDAQQGAYFRAGQGTVFGMYPYQGGSTCGHTQIVFGVGDVEGVTQQLKQKGVRFEEYDQPGLKTYDSVADMGGGMQGAWFKDPGGNICGIVTTTSEMQQMMMSGQRGVVTTG